MGVFVASAGRLALVAPWGASRPIARIHLVAGKIPFLGKLAGDIAVQRRSWSFYFPLTTCIIISIILTLIMWFFGRR